MEIGSRLRSQRKRNKLTLGQVGQYEGLSVQYLSDLELGRNRPAVWDLLLRLARRYRTSADYLLGLVDDPGGNRGLNEDETALLAAFHALHPEQQQAALALLQDNVVLDALLDAMRTLGELNRRLAPRIIGQMDSEGSPMEIRGLSEDKEAEL